MQTLNLVQGSPEWLAHRSQTHIKNASDAPAMMGVSPYETRDELLHRKATGIIKPVSASVQKRFDDGHRFEDLARPLAAEIIGSPLYPVTGVSGDRSASFDGLTMMEDEGFEHKSLNDELRSIMVGDFTGTDLPIYHRIQMEQQLMVCDGARILFMASKWDENDQLLEERHCWYYPDLKLRQDIVNGWAQLDIDLANYTPSAVKEMPKAEVSIELPTLFIHARGEITSDNMEAYGIALAKRLEEVRAIVLTDDQDFVNAKEAAKKLRDGIVKAQQAKEAMLAQTVTVGEASRMIDAWCEDMRVTALKLEKDVEREDSVKKQNIILGGKSKINELVAELKAVIAPIALIYKEPNFAEAIKGKRNYSSMESAVNDMVAATSVELRGIASDVKGKMNWFESVVGDFKNPLFPDLQTVIYKPMDDFQLVVNTRVNEQKKRDADIAAEAAKKALVAEQVSGVNPQVSEGESATAQDQVAENVSSPTLSKTILKKAKPSAIEVVDLVAKHFMVSKDIAADWLSDIDFQHMKKVA